MAEEFFILFRQGAYDLARAEVALKARGLIVSRQRDQLHVRSQDGPALWMVLATGPDVATEAVEFGEGSGYEAALRHLDARFEVFVEDLVAFGETDTVEVVQHALQTASNGYLFVAWDDELSPPPGR